VRGRLTTALSGFKILCDNEEMTVIDTHGNELTINQAIDAYLRSVSLARSVNTYHTYRNGMAAFRNTLEDNGLDLDHNSTHEIPEEAVGWFAADLKSFAPSTERLYLTAATGLYEYLAAENLAEINLPRIHLLIRQRSRRPGIRLPQFPKNAISELLEKIDGLKSREVANELDHLINLRDRAFLITLGDTGLRVHEACNLVRGDVDWFESRAVIIGKGNKQAVVRFSQRSMAAIKDYLAARGTIDGSSGRPLRALPLFARHDKAVGKRVKAISTTSGRQIVRDRVAEFLGEEAVGTITPHSFRHYFVTTVLQASGNLKLAQELARHQSISVTQRYAHLNDDELDQGYTNIFDRKKL